MTHLITSIPRPHSDIIFSVSGLSQEELNKNFNIKLDIPVDIGNYF